MGSHGKEIEIYCGAEEKEEEKEKFITERLGGFRRQRGRLGPRQKGTGQREKLGVKMLGDRSHSCGMPFPNINKNSSNYKFRDVLHKIAAGAENKDGRSIAKGLRLTVDMNRKYCQEKRQF